MTWPLSDIWRAMSSGREWSVEREMFSEEMGSCGLVSVTVRFVMTGELSRMTREVVRVIVVAPSPITTSEERD